MKPGVLKEWMLKWTGVDVILEKLQRELVESRQQLDEVVSREELLRLLVREKEVLLDDLRKTIERERKREKDLSDKRMQTQMEDLFARLATPVVQMLTIVHHQERSEYSDSEQQASCWTLIRGLLQELSEMGLVSAGEIGSRVLFDGSEHDGITESFDDGEHVRIVMPGLVFRDRVVRKAAVVRESNLHGRESSENGERFDASATERLGSAIGGE